MSYPALRNCLKFTSTALLLLMLQSTYGQRDWSTVDGVLERHQKQLGNQFAVMIWQDTIIYQKQAGDLTTATQVPVGSASAWLTAALTMTFVDQGKISLDDPVSKYLPVFAKYAKGYLTIRHCLANVTGLEPDKGGMQKVFQKNKFETLEEEVNSFASSREIMQNPGKAFHYNQIGSNIVGRVLEVVGKRSFDRLMLERIFRPLGMKKSSFSSDRAVNPFAGAVSTPADYLKFLTMLLNKGMAGPKKILSEQSIAEMQKIQTGEAKIVSVPPTSAGYSYALGSWVDPVNTPGTFMSPGITGSWPFLNTAQRYACVIFTVPHVKEDKEKVYRDIMETVQQQLNNR